MAKYNQNVQQRANDQDYIFYDGDDLRSLDPGWTEILITRDIVSD